MTLPVAAIWITLQAYLQIAVNFKLVIAVMLALVLLGIALRRGWVK